MAGVPNQATIPGDHMATQMAETMGDYVLGGFDIEAPQIAKQGKHIILYGPPKSGKTSTLDDPNMKILVADLEGGNEVLAGSPNARIVNIQEHARKKGIHPFEAIVQFIMAIESGVIKGFDGYALDSLTQFEDILKDYIATKYAPNRKRGETKKFGDSAQSDWGDLKDLITRTVKRVHALTKRRDKVVHWIWIAHVAQTKDPVTEQAVATKIQLQGGNTAEVVMSIVDGFFYFYNRPYTVEVDGKQVPEIERGIITKTVGIFVAGVRESKANRGSLPARIPNPVWSEIFEKMGYVEQE
jgi:hypothetical protein